MRIIHATEECTTNAVLSQSATMSDFRVFRELTLTINIICVENDTLPPPKHHIYYGMECKIKLKSTDRAVGKHRCSLYSRTRYTNPHT